jgi:hypothetical protein
MSNQEFDSYFVGDGSAALANLTKPNDFVSQLAQLFTNSSTNSVSQVFEIENDLGMFGELSTNARLINRNGKGLAKCPSSSIAKIFLTTKKATYSTFNYLNLLAEQVGNVPIKEEDLIVTENDQYIIEYLKKNRISKASAENVARLIAFQDMGINQVRYFDECMCPICKVYSGKIFDIDFVMQQVMAGEYLTHPGTGSYRPVIYRESYTGPLTQAENFNIELLTSHEIEFVNVPIELRHHITTLLPIILNPCDNGVVMCGNPINRVEFVNMSTYLKGQSDIDGIVVYREGNVLYVHNSYVGHMGPIEFAEAWVKSNVTEKVAIKELAKCEKFFVNGTRVAKHRGFYWSLETGEKVQ